MGRKNKKYLKDLREQAYEKLTSMLSFGESKRKAILNDDAQDKIFSRNTFKTYWKHIKYFVSYVEKFHPECKSLKKSRAYVTEWLESRESEYLSAWTIQTEAKALGKLFGITPYDIDYYIPPKRERSNIKRSRIPAVRDKHFSETNNHEFICFCKGTGLRRHEIEKTKGKDLVDRNSIQQELDNYDLFIKNTHAKALEDALMFDVDYFIHTFGKGGRERYAPIIGEHATSIVERMKNTHPEEKVWLHVPSNADIHSFRSDYAVTIYKLYARDIDTIPKDKTNKGLKRKYQSEVYHCRKDEYGKKIDKNAMLKISKALGHNRLEIVANNYIRGI